MFGVPESLLDALIQSACTQAAFRTRLTKQQTCGDRQVQLFDVVDFFFGALFRLNFCKASSTIRKKLSCSISTTLFKPAWIMFFTI